MTPFKDLLHLPLASTSEPAMTLVLVLGYLWLDRSRYFLGISLLCTSLPFNVALKTWFGVPLAAFLHHPGYAFPSGHMQSGAVLYGWLGLTEPRPLLRVALGALLLSIGWGLVNAGYHTLADVSGAVLVAAGLLGTTRWLLACRPQWHVQVGLLLLSVFSMLAIWGLHDLPAPPHAWKGVGLQVGALGASWALNRPERRPPNTRVNALATVFFTAALWAVTTCAHAQAPWVAGLISCALGAWLPTSLAIAQRFVQSPSCCQRGNA